MEDVEEEIVPEQINGIDFCRVGGDETPFVVEKADMLLPVASVVGYSTVSCLLDVKHSSSSDLNSFMRSCNVN